MEERRCGCCEQTIRPYEGHRLLGIPIVRRYRCTRCSTKFDILTRFGESFLLVIGAALPVVVALLPQSKLRSSDDRGWILAFLIAQLGLFIAVVARGRANARRHAATDLSAHR
jgi:hypothetical protein